MRQVHQYKIFCFCHEATERINRLAIERDVRTRVGARFLDDYLLFAFSKTDEDYRPALFARLVARPECGVQLTLASVYQENIWQTPSGNIFFDLS